jgi:uncharacterized iron-regulated membrane protein
MGPSLLMRLVRLAHRWIGGLVGLLLFVLGLTGTVLVFKDDWLRLVVPHAAEARVSDPSVIGAALDQAFAAPDRPRSVILPNGRTQVWFDPADGRIVGARDALALPLGLRVANAQYPIHAAKVGGLPYRLVVAASGVALTLLGSLAVFTFWGNPSGLPKRRGKRV